MVLVLLTFSFIQAGSGSEIRGSDQGEVSVISSDGYWLFPGTSLLLDVFADHGQFSIGDRYETWYLSAFDCWGDLGPHLTLGSCSVGGAHARVVIQIGMTLPHRNRGEWQVNHGNQPFMFRVTRNQEITATIHDGEWVTTSWTNVIEPPSSIP